MKAKENIWPCILQGLTDDELLRAQTMQLKRAQDPKTEASASKYIDLIIAEMARRNRGIELSKNVPDYPEPELSQISDSMPESPSGESW